jgi:DNA-binding IscR family transcriptional regulator
MLDLNAVDSDRRQSTEAIAAKASGGDANALKVVMSELRSRCLIETKTGRGGGCWLVERGRVRATKLRDVAGNSARVSTPFGHRLACLAAPHSSSSGSPSR